jgi:2-methylcitrate dehydratase PrpD
VAAVAPQAAYNLGGPPEGLSSAISAFMARIQVRAEDALLAPGDPQGSYPKAWPAHVTVTAASGRRERTVTHVPGDPSRPYSEADVKAKFLRVVAPVLERDRAEAEFAAACSALERPAAFIRTIGQIAVGKSTV